MCSPLVAVYRKGLLASRRHRRQVERSVGAGHTDLLRLLSGLEYLENVPEEGGTLREVARQSEFLGLLEAEKLKVIKRSGIVIPYSLRNIEVDTKVIRQVEVAPDSRTKAVVVLKLEESEV